MNGQRQDKYQRAELNKLIYDIEVPKEYHGKRPP